MTNSPDEFDAVRDVVKALANFKSDDQQRILRWAAEKLGLNLAQQIRVMPSGNADLPLGHMPEVQTQGRSSPVDIKSFVDSKKPKNDRQFATVVAYYHRFEAPEADRKDAINKDDLVDACRKANYDRLPVPIQTLHNTVNAGLLDKAGKGLFSISSVGENLVAITLPGDAASVGNTRKRRARGTPARTKNKAATKRTPAKK